MCHSNLLMNLLNLPCAHFTKFQHLTCYAREHFYFWTMANLLFCVDIENTITNLLYVPWNFSLFSSRQTYSFYHGKFYIWMRANLLGVLIYGYVRNKLDYWWRGRLLSMCQNHELTARSYGFPSAQTYSSKILHVLRTYRNAQYYLDIHWHKHTSWIRSLFQVAEVASNCSDTNSGGFAAMHP